jgi:hypothetical protein
VCKILRQEQIKPHKVRYYLERRDAEFEQKMAEVLCVYRQVQILKKAANLRTAQAGGDRLLRRKARNPGDRNDGPGSCVSRAPQIVLEYQPRGDPTARPSLSSRCPRA